ncbi:MAG: type IV pilus assembly protein PilB [Kiritimatiellia bacterium]|jgi:type IV pilus assembly protein PilB
METKTSFVQLLLLTEFLSEEQLARIPEQYLPTPVALGNYLIDEGMLTADDIATLLSQHLMIERYRPVKYETGTDLAYLLPVSMAMTNHVVPLSLKGDLLKLGMMDPTDIDTMDLVEQQTRMEVDAVLCTQSELDRLISAVYGVTIGFDGVEDEEGMFAHDEGDLDGLAEDQNAGNIEISSLINLAEGAPVVRLVNMIVAQAVREKASDIHISPERKGLTIRFRRDGHLIEVAPPPKHMLLAIVSRIKVLAKMDISVSRVPQDGRFTMRIAKREINIRVSSIPTINGENIVMRLLDMSASMYSLDKLGMNPQNRAQIERLMRAPYGMILATGPTGSGKSTTLYAILKELNAPDVNIITVEDPVEYRMDKIRQVELNTRAGMTFASGLRSILRQDPDIIMVGEIRDHETAAIAVQAALTGHRVLSTVHTNTAVGAITRLIDMGLEPFLVASTLMVTNAQRLLRRVCSHCAEHFKPTDEAIAFLGLSDHTDATYKTAKGCSSCMGTGYQGRVGIYEVLVIDDAIEDMIVRRASEQEIVTYACLHGGMRTLKADAAEKVAAGLTTFEEAMSAVVV